MERILQLLTLGLPPAGPQLGEESPSFPALRLRNPLPHAEVWGRRAAPNLPIAPWALGSGTASSDPPWVRIWNRIWKLSLEVLPFLVLIPTASALL